MSIGTHNIIIINLWQPIPFPIKHLFNMWSSEVVMPHHLDNVLIDSLSCSNYMAVMTQIIKLSWCSDKDYCNLGLSKREVFLGLGKFMVYSGTNSKMSTKYAIV